MHEMNHSSGPKNKMLQFLELADKYFFDYRIISTFSIQHRGYCGSSGSILVNIIRSYFRRLDSGYQALNITSLSHSYENKMLSIFWKCCKLDRAKKQE